MLISGGFGILLNVCQKVRAEKDDERQKMRVHHPRARHSHSREVELEDCVFRLCCCGWCVSHVSVWVYTFMFLSAYGDISDRCDGTADGEWLHQVWMCTIISLLTIPALCCFGVCFFSAAPWGDMEKDMERLQQQRARDLRPGTRVVSDLRP
jgi:hypothetical protein